MHAEPVVLVVGRPASGKSTIARRIAARFDLPLLAKDDFKESLHDVLGPGDRVWSSALGRAAFAALDLAVEQQLRGRRAFAVDANYDSRFEQAAFQRRQAQYGFTAVQVHCTAPVEVLVERFAARAMSGERHAAHLDAAHLDAFRAGLEVEVPEVFALEGPVLRLDATGGEGAALGVLRALDTILGGARAGATG